MKSQTVKLNKAMLWVWLQEGVDAILQDIADRDASYEADYFTATDLEAWVRYCADREMGESNARCTGRARWWGYNGWTRVVVTDKAWGEDLLGLCRRFIADRVRFGQLEAHNFGRGHCSGMRLRAKGSGLSEAEQATVAKKQRPKLVHAEDPATRWPHKSLCTAKARATNKAKSRGYSGMRSHRSATRTTDNPAEVTCPRCKKLLENA